MSKNEKAKTKSARATVHAKTSATSTKDVLPKKLNQNGCRRLAIAVIKSALTCEPKDVAFLESDWYDFWAMLVFGADFVYYTGEEVIKNELKRDGRRIGRPKGTPPNNKLKGKGSK